MTKKKKTRYVIAKSNLTGDEKREVHYSRTGIKNYLREICNTKEKILIDGMYKSLTETGSYEDDQFYVEFIDDKFYNEED